MGAKCPSCGRQGQEIEFSIYKCKCGIEWTEPVKKASLIARRPGWFTRNYRNFLRLFKASIFIFLLFIGVAMAMKPVVI